MQKEKYHHQQIHILKLKNYKKKSTQSPHVISSSIVNQANDGNVQTHTRESTKNNNKIKKNNNHINNKNKRQIRQQRQQQAQLLLLPKKNLSSNYYFRLLK